MLNSFNKFIEHLEEKKKFDVAEMQHFMESLFKKAGYRQNVPDLSSETLNILICLESGVEQLLLASAALRGLRRSYPNAHITLVTEKTSENLAAYCPHISEVLLLDPRGTLITNFDDVPNVINGITARLEVVKNLLRCRYDVAFAILYGDGAAAPLLAYMSGAKKIISSHSEIWAPIVNEFIDQKHLGEHFDDQMLSYVEYLTGKTVSDRQLEVWFSKDDLERMKELLPQSKKIYAIGLGGHVTSELSYPPVPRDEMMNMIVEDDDDVSFVVLGSRANSADAALLIDIVGSERVVNFAGRLSARQMAAAMSLCNLYIGNDTFLVHLAAALKKPVFS